jgi:hypothetical protein
VIAGQLDWYKKSRENVLVIVADNTNLNPYIARNITMGGSELGGKHYCPAPSAQSHSQCPRTTNRLRSLSTINMDAKVIRSDKHLDRQSIGLNQCAWNSLLHSNGIFGKSKSLFCLIQFNQSNNQRTCTGIGKLLTYAVLIPSPPQSPESTQSIVDSTDKSTPDTSAENIVYVSNDWIQDNNLNFNLLDRVRIEASGFIELDEIILECLDTDTYHAAQRDGTFVILSLLLSAILFNILIALTAETNSQQIRNT